MTFDEALKLMREGKKLTRKKWNGAYIFILEAHPMSAKAAVANL